MKELAYTNAVLFNWLDISGESIKVRDGSENKKFETFVVFVRLVV
jgi:hypothetical protein